MPTDTTPARPTKPEPQLALPCGFRWASSFLGVVEFDVSGDGATYRIAVRRQATAYERSIYNGSDAEWQRDVVASIDRLRRAASSDKPIPEAIVKAFNAWQKAMHENSIAWLRANPERYGEIADDDPLLIPPRPVIGVHYVVGTGWVESWPAPAFKAAAEVSSDAEPDAPSTTQIEAAPSTGSHREIDALEHEGASVLCL